MKPIKDKKEAIEIMKKGKRVFRESEPGHIYHMKGDKIICSCGKKVDWRMGGEHDLVIYRKRKGKKAFVKECPDCWVTLDGNYCNSCNTRWEIKSTTNREEVNNG